VSVGAGLLKDGSLQVQVPGKEGQLVNLKGQKPSQPTSLVQTVAHTFKLWIQAQQA